MMTLSFNRVKLLLPICVMLGLAALSACRKKIPSIHFSDGQGRQIDSLLLKSKIISKGYYIIGPTSSNVYRKRIMATSPTKVPQIVVHTPTNSFLPSISQKPVSPPTTNIYLYRDTALFHTPIDDLNKYSSQIDLYVFSMRGFRSCVFTGEFTGDLRTSRSVFWKPLSFEFCIFNDTSQLEPFPGLKLARITRCTFQKPVGFIDNRYQDDFAYIQCSFHKDFYFQNSFDTIRVNISMENCKSFRLIQFHDDSKRLRRGNIFSKSLTFSEDSITGKLDLSGCKFLPAGRLVYDRSTLPDTLDLSNMQLRGETNLLNSLSNIHGRKCQLSLYGTNIDSLVLNYDYFHLYFPSHMSDSLKYHDEISRVYTTLLANFKKNGFENSYRQADIEYKEWQSRDDWELWLSNLWWKFGYQKWRIVLISLIIILLLSGCNFFIYRKLHAVYPVVNLKWSRLNQKQSGLKGGVRRALLTLLYTTLIFFSLGFDFKNINFTPVRYAFILIFEYTIGLVCTAFLIHWVIG